MHPQEFFTAPTGTFSEPTRVLYCTHRNLFWNHKSPLLYPLEPLTVPARALYSTHKIHLLYPQELFLNLQEPLTVPTGGAALS
jgi:hypothetical protein